MIIAASWAAWLAASVRLIDWLAFRAHPREDDRRGARRRETVVVGGALRAAGGCGAGAESAADRRLFLWRRSPVRHCFITGWLAASSSIGWRPGR